MTNKSLILIVAVACASATLVPQAAKADSTNTTLNLFAQAENLLSIHDATKQFYTNNNELELQQGGVTDSRKSGIYQATKIGFYHKLNNTFDVGLDVEIDSLGSFGNSVDLLGGHVNLRYDWDNVAMKGFVGGFRDIDASRLGAEFGLSFEYRISKTLGFFTAASMGYQKNDTGAKNGDIFERLMVGASLAIGK